MRFFQKTHLFKRNFSPYFRGNTVAVQFFSSIQTNLSLKIQMQKNSKLSKAYKVNNLKWTQPENFHCIISQILCAKNLFLYHVQSRFLEILYLYFRNFVLCPVGCVKKQQPYIYKINYFIMLEMFLFMRLGKLWTKHSFCFVFIPTTEPINNGNFFIHKRKHVWKRNQLFVRQNKKVMHFLCLRK